LFRFVVLSMLAFFSFFSLSWLIRIGTSITSARCDAILDKNVWVAQRDCGVAHP
jgi:hypothetical protein